MPFKIQRNPRGLNDLLSIAGGATPIELEDRVRGVVDFLQFYGLQQQRIVTRNDAALAEGSNVTIGAGFPELTPRWAVLFGATATCLKTATMTALRFDISVSRNGANNVQVASAEGGPFGATETGPVSLPFVAPYPMLLVPPWNIAMNLRILGTDPNANSTISAEIGILG